jgi:Domain of unknown function (DUF222)/HNH endonuclease
MYVRIMVVAVEVIEALAELPPGPQLAIALADIDSAQVPNNELLPLLTAQSRQAAHESARLLSVIAEVGRANPTFDDSAIDRLDHPFRHAPDEVRAALSWSRRAAEAECALAEQLVHHLPVVHAAFLAGEIDRPKVRVFADHLGGLTQAQIATICAAVVPLAGRLTPGQLVVRLRRLVAAIDPRHYERRYRKALRDRTVCAWLDEDGTAVLSARGLSPAQAEAALERIDGLAHAARRAGHPSTLDQIRVDVLAGLLDGTLHHLRREDIVAHLITHRSTDDAGDARIQASGQDTADPPADRAAMPASPAATTTAGDSRSVGDSESPIRTPSGTDSGSASTGRPASDGSSADEDQRVGIEVRVALSTLLGDDEQPGEIPGLGPIPAGHARAVVARQRRAEWRIAVTDADGRLLVDGITRRRPTGLVPDGPPGGIVELHVPATMLPRLTRSNRPVDPAVAAWAGVVADIARQHAERDRRDLDAHPDDRLPRAALRRHTEIRDRTCIGVGCRHRPRRCDQDHTVDYQHGGTTTADDLAPLCRHDHTLKHEAGWTLEQPLPGTFTWTSPLGGRYDVEPEPVLPPLPHPCPAPDDPHYDQPATPGPDTLTLWRPAPRPPPPEPDPVDLDELPPF